MIDERNRHARGMARAARRRLGVVPLWLITLGTLDSLAWWRGKPVRRQAMAVAGPKSMLPC